MKDVNIYAMGNFFSGLSKQALLKHLQTIPAMKIGIT